MELKVWVEGIQRVICGVGEQTTCQDVVIALANAIGKTGRFTLVERWRDNERLLSPSESPLQVLHKWGEYAMDVQFILRQSESWLKGSKKSHRTDKFSHNFTPHNSSAAIKKSLTFSGGHSYSIFPPKTGRPALIRRSGKENSSLESLDDQRSVTSQSSRSTLSPYASFEGRPKAATIQGYANSSRSPYGSFENKRWAQSPRSTSSNSTPVGSLERRPKKPPGAQQSIADSHQRKSPRSPSPVAEYDLNKNIAGHKLKTTEFQKNYGTKTEVKTVNGIDGANTEHIQGKPVPGKPASGKPTPVASSSSSQSSSTPSSSTSLGTTTATVLSSAASRDQLLKLMSLQVDKLNRQDSQLKALDSEILVVEKREDDHKKKESAIQSELQQLQAAESDQYGELEELELVSWDDKLAIESRQGQHLAAELSQLKSKLEKCEAELHARRRKCLEMDAELESERAKQSQDKKEQETKISQEISDLQKQINEKLQQHKENQSSIESLQGEVKRLESAISNGKTQIANLQTDLKDVNLGQFSQVPWRPSPTREAKPPFSRSSSARPGGTRRMLQSPSLLKETVATDKNPHGLWV